MDDERAPVRTLVPGLTLTAPTDAITGWPVDHPPPLDATTGLPYPVPLPTEPRDTHRPEVP